MAGVLARDRQKVPFAVDEHPVGALGSRGADPPLGITIRPRVRGGILITVTPSPAKMVAKTLVNFASRSRIKKRKEPVRSPRAMSRMPACWAVHPPSGGAV